MEIVFYQKSLQKGLLTQKRCQLKRLVPIQITFSMQNLVIIIIYFWQSALAFFLALSGVCLGDCYNRSVTKFGENMLFNDPALRALKQKFDREKVKKEGCVKATDRGFGFLEVDRDQSYFIAPNDMRNVMHGDRISALIEDDGNGRKHAIPQSLIEAYLKRFVARVLFANGKLNIIPDHPNIKTRIVAIDKRENTQTALKNGDYVICTLYSHALKGHGFKADINELICRQDDPKAPWSVSLRRYDLPLTEPCDQEFSFLESAYDRCDLTNLDFVTIDSEHTEDMDDALYIEKNEQGFVLYVAIADPTGYISEDSELNTKAANRAFSIYLPGRDIPMLPRVLSDDLCSLREGKSRPTIVGAIHCDLDGKIDFSATKFMLANIVSKGKLVYNEVSDYLEGKEGAKEPSENIAKILKTLVEFTHARDHYRATHAATFRNRPDYDFILNEQGALDHIEVNHRRIANQIVEEAMIAANISAGEMLKDKLNCGIFNVHAGFDMDKKNDILALLEQEHCPLPESGIDSLQGYNEIRRFANAKDDNYMDCRIRRLQAFSQMSIAPAPHFALGVDNYATWTSPIRKYGDMVNHRLLKAIIVNAAHPTLPDDELLQKMNLARRTNRMAERDVRDWLYMDYLEPDIAKGTVFEAEVFDLSRGGLRVILEENGAMVFVPSVFISDNRDAFILDGDLGILTVAGATKLRLGDKVYVKIVEINRTTRSITAMIAQSVGGLLLPDPKKIETKNTKR